MGQSANELAYIRLARIKGALKLESVGLKTHKTAIRPILAEEFGLGPGAPFHRYIEVCQQRMNELLAAKERGDDTT